MIKNPPLAASVFFFHRENEKYPWNTFLAILTRFFTGTFCVSRPQFFTFLTFSRALFFFNVHFLSFFFTLKFWFHGRKFTGTDAFSRVNVEFFTGIGIDLFSRDHGSRVEFNKNFHRHIFFFTYTFWGIYIFFKPIFFSRALFLIFSRVLFFLTGKKAK